MMTHIHINNYREVFKNFLSSNEIYDDNAKYWSDLISENYRDDIYDWVDNKFANSEELKDGNPLFSCRLSNGKAIRIIQSDRDSLSPIFASWNSNYEIESKKIDELVIALQPYKNTYRDAEYIIIKFISNRKYKTEQRTLNLRYNRLTNLKRIRSIIEFSNKTGLNVNSWILHKDTFSEGKFNFNLFKKLYELNENLIFYESKFQNNELKKTYNETLRSISNLNEIITLKNQYDLTSNINKREYISKINNEYARSYIFINCYNKRVDDLEEKVTRLKESYNEVIVHDDQE